MLLPSHHCPHVWPRELILAHNTIHDLSRRLDGQQSQRRTPQCASPNHHHASVIAPPSASGRSPPQQDGAREATDRPPHALFSLRGNSSDDVTSPLVSDWLGYRPSDAVRDGQAQSFTHGGTDGAVATALLGDADAVSECDSALDDAVSDDSDVVIDGNGEALDVRERKAGGCSKAQGHVPPAVPVTSPVPSTATHAGSHGGSSKGRAGAPLVVPTPPSSGPVKPATKSPSSRQKAAIGGRDSAGRGGDVSARAVVATIPSAASVGFNGHASGGNGTAVAVVAPSTPTSTAAAPSPARSSGAVSAPQTVTPPAVAPPSAPEPASASTVTASAPHAVPFPSTTSTTGAVSLPVASVTPSAPGSSLVASTTTTSSAAPSPASAAASMSWPPAVTLSHTAGLPVFSPLGVTLDGRLGAASRVDAVAGSAPSVSDEVPAGDIGPSGTGLWTPLQPRGPVAVMAGGATPVMTPPSSARERLLEENVSSVGRRRSSGSDDDGLRDLLDNDGDLSEHSFVGTSPNTTVGSVSSRHSRLSKLPPLPDSDSDVEEEK